jgi:hypothetical protein
MEKNRGGERRRAGGNHYLAVCNFSQTPLWLWAAVSAAALGVLNYVCFGWRQTASGGSKSGAKSTVIIALGAVVLLLDLILRYLHR